MKISTLYHKLSVFLFVVFLLGSCIKVPQFDVMLSESQMTVNENSGSVSVEFVLPEGTRNQDVEVDYRLGGTAEEGVDYTTREPRFIIIPHGSTSVSFTIDLIDNIEQEGSKTIVVAIILIVQNGNTIYQGAERQSLTILINDDDCSIYLAGEWDYLAQYQMYADGDTIQVGQDGLVLERGTDPNFYGKVSIEDPEGNRNYFIVDMMVGMFSLLDIETPCPLLDECGILSGPNDASIFVMGELPAYITGNIENDTIMLEFEYTTKDLSSGGGGYAILTRN